MTDTVGTTADGEANSTSSSSATAGSPLSGSSPQPAAEGSLEDLARLFSGAGDGPAVAEEEAEKVSDGKQEPVGEQAQAVANAPLAIQAPVGMTAEQASEFAGLPVNAQRFLAQQEANRTADYGRKTAAIAGQRRQFEALVGELEQARNTQAEELSQMASNDVSPPDMALLEADPSEYVRQLGLYEHIQKERSTAQERLTTLQQEQMDAQQGQLAAFQEEESHKLAELIPEMGDAAKAPALKAEIATYAIRNGVSEQELASVSARDVVLLRKAMFYDRARTMAQEAKAKASAPITSKPGAGNSAVNRRSGQSRSELLKTHREKGSLDTMAALWANEIGVD